MSVKIFSLSRLLGRQGMIKNNLISKAKNYMREDDDFTNSCVTTNDDRYFNLDDRSSSILIYRKRYREIKY